MKKETEVEQKKKTQLCYQIIFLKPARVKLDNNEIIKHKNRQENYTVKLEEFTKSVSGSSG